MAPELHRRLAGVYENETRLEIAVREGKLVMYSGDLIDEIQQSSDNVFQARLHLDLPLLSENFALPVLLGSQPVYAHSRSHSRRDPPEETRARRPVPLAEVLSVRSTLSLLHTRFLVRA